MRPRGLWVLLVVFVAGCGASTPIQGTVTLDGHPVSDGSISFEPADGAGPSFGAAITEGRFQVSREAPVTGGTKRVRIRGSIKTGKRVAAGPPLPPGTMTDEVRYYPGPGVKEELREVEVVAGRVNDLQFELKAGKAGR
jgi:hypothetical protein